MAFAAANSVDPLHHHLLFLSGFHIDAIVRLLFIAMNSQSLIRCRSITSTCATSDDESDGSWPSSSTEDDVEEGEHPPAYDWASHFQVGRPLHGRAALMESTFTHRVARSTLVGSRWVPLGVDEMVDAKDVFRTPDRSLERAIGPGSSSIADADLAPRGATRRFGSLVRNALGLTLTQTSVIKSELDGNWWRPAPIRSVDDQVYFGIDRLGNSRHEQLKSNGGREGSSFDWRRDDFVVDLSSNEGEILRLRSVSAEGRVLKAQVDGFVAWLRDDRLMRDILLAVGEMDTQMERLLLLVYFHGRSADPTGAFKRADPKSRKTSPSRLMEEERLASRLRLLEAASESRSEAGQGSSEVTSSAQHDEMVYLRTRLQAERNDGYFNYFGSHWRQLIKPTEVERRYGRSKRNILIADVLPRSGFDRERMDVDTCMLIAASSAVGCLHVVDHSAWTAPADAEGTGGGMFGFLDHRSVNATSDRSLYRRVLAHTLKNVRDAGLAMRTEICPLDPKTHLPYNTTSRPDPTLGDVAHGRTSEVLDAYVVATTAYASLMHPVNGMICKQLVKLHELREQNQLDEFNPPLSGGSRTERGGGGGDASAEQMGEDVDMTHAADGRLLPLLPPWTSNCAPDLAHVREACALIRWSPYAFPTVGPNDYRPRWANLTLEQTEDQCIPLRWVVTDTADHEKALSGVRWDFRTERARVELLEELHTRRLVGGLDGTAATALSMEIKAVERVACHDRMLRMADEMTTGWLSLQTLMKHVETSYQNSARRSNARRQYADNRLRVDARIQEDSEAHPSTVLLSAHQRDRLLRTLEADSSHADGTITRVLNERVMDVARRVGKLLCELVQVNAERDVHFENTEVTTRHLVTLLRALWIKAAGVQESNVAAHITALAYPMVESLLAICPAHRMDMKHVASTIVNVGRKRHWDVPLPTAERLALQLRHDEYFWRTVSERCAAVEALGKRRQSAGLNATRNAIKTQIRAACNPVRRAHRRPPTETGQSSVRAHERRRYRATFRIAATALQWYDDPEELRCWLRAHETAMRASRVNAFAVCAHSGTAEPSRILRTAVRQQIIRTAHLFTHIVGGMELLTHRERKMYMGAGGLPCAALGAVQQAWHEVFVHHSTRDADDDAAAPGLLGGQWSTTCSKEPDVPREDGSIEGRSKAIARRLDDLMRGRAVYRTATDDVWRVDLYRLYVSGEDGRHVFYTLRSRLNHWNAELKYQYQLYLHDKLDFEYRESTCRRLNSMRVPATTDEFAVQEIALTRRDVLDLALSQRTTDDERFVFFWTMLRHSVSNGVVSIDQLLAIRERLASEWVSLNAPRLKLVTDLVTDVSAVVEWQFVVNSFLCSAADESLRTHLRAADTFRQDLQSATRGRTALLPSCSWFGLPPVALNDDGSIRWAHIRPLREWYATVHGHGPRGQSIFSYFMYPPDGGDPLLGSLLLGADADGAPFMAMSEALVEAIDQISELESDPRPPVRAFDIDTFPDYARLVACTLRSNEGAMHADLIGEPDVAVTTGRVKALLRRTAQHRTTSDALNGLLQRLQQAEPLRNDEGTVGEFCGYTRRFTQRRAPPGWVAHHDARAAAERSIDADGTTRVDRRPRATVESCADLSAAFVPIPRRCVIDPLNEDEWIDDSDDDDQMTSDAAEMMNSRYEHCGGGKRPKPGGKGMQPHHRGIDYHHEHDAARRDKHMGPLALVSVPGLLHFSDDDVICPEPDDSPPDDDESARPVQWPNLQDPCIVALNRTIAERAGVAEAAIGAQVSPTDGTLAALAPSPQHARTRRRTGPLHTLPPTAPTAAPMAKLPHTLWLSLVDGQQPPTWDATLGEWHGLPVDHVQTHTDGSVATRSLAMSQPRTCLAYLLPFMLRSLYSAGAHLGPDGVPVSPHYITFNDGAWTMAVPLDYHGVGAVWSIVCDSNGTESQQYDEELLSPHSDFVRRLRSLAPNEQHLDLTRAEMSLYNMDDFLRHPWDDDGQFRKLFVQVGAQFFVSSNSLFFVQGEHSNITLTQAGRVFFAEEVAANVAL